MTLRIISYGGGVQSTALVVLAATGQLGQVDAAVYSNVGDDSEHPATNSYVRDVAQPWAAERGFPVHIVHKTLRDGSLETLRGRLMREGSRSLPIPVRMDNGAPGTRSCTADFKIKVIAKWIKAHGATEGNPATVLVGISTDEVERLNNRRVGKLEVVEYPLIDLRLSRADCENIIRRAGLPVPHKSSCYFCPFHRPQVWAEMRRDEPELFWDAVHIERTLNERRDLLGKDHVYLTRFAKPLDEAISEAQQSLFSEGNGTGEICDEGYCWT